MLMPVAFQLARRTNTSPSYLLMPMAFGSLLGGTMTLIGTSPERHRVAHARGARRRALRHVRLHAGRRRRSPSSGSLFLAFGYRLLPAGRKGTASLDAAFNIKGYMTEAQRPGRIRRWSGKTVADLEKLGEGEVEVSTIIRERFRRYTPSPSWTLRAGRRAASRGRAGGARAGRRAGQAAAGGARGRPGGSDDRQRRRCRRDGGGGDAQSPLVGRTPGQAHLGERYQVGLLAVSRSGERLTHRLRTIRFQPGDVIVLQGDLTQMPETLGELRCLPLAERDIRLGRGRRRFVPIIVLAAAMLLVAIQIVPVAFGFFSAAADPDPRALDQPARGLRGDRMAAPDSDRLRSSRSARRMQTTGATDLIAAWLSATAAALPPIGALALILVAGHGGDAVPQQRGDRARHGADRGAASPASSATTPTRS